MLQRRKKIFISFHTVPVQATNLNCLLFSHNSEAARHLWNKSDSCGADTDLTTITRCCLVKVILQLCNKVIKTVGFRKFPRCQRWNTPCYLQLHLLCYANGDISFMGRSCDAVHSHQQEKKKKKKRESIDNTGEMWRMWCDSQALCRDEYNEEDNLWGISTSSDTQRWEPRFSTSYWN